MIYLGSILFCYGFFLPHPITRQTYLLQKYIQRITAVYQRRKGGKKPHLETIITEVTTRLHAGESTHMACMKALEPVVDEAQQAQIFHHSVPPEYMLWMARHRMSKNSLYILPSLIVAFRFSASSGCPLVSVLHQVSASLSEAAQALRKRRLAMAGPKTSARILIFLPFVGIGFAHVMGAQPMHLFFHTAIGALIFLTGIGLMAIGAVWSSHVIDSASYDREFT
ncbi:MAG: hypothetical protein Q4P66_07015 [Actinomycetaceae bacterium]|nr:hypothetical protein [Actinomycetaceae bacterium]